MMAHSVLPKKRTEVLRVDNRRPRLDQEEPAES